MSVYSKEGSSEQLSPLDMSCKEPLMKGRLFCKPKDHFWETTKLQARFVPDRSYVPCGAVSDLTRPKNDDHSPQLRRRMLYEIISDWSRKYQNWANSRFSPVWLYICVCSELGLVKRLSQILHLCFFCELEDILELNELIIDSRVCGILLPASAGGLGSVREESASSEV